MAWIRVIDEKEATGDLKAHYERIKKSRGKVANIMKIHSLHPEAMKAHLELYLAIMFGKSGLSRRQRELLATVVSAMNGCEYCIRHHAEALRFYAKDDDWVKQIQHDYTKANLSEKDRQMLDYAAKLTHSPSSVTEKDVEALRAVGFSDEEILSINLITSYFNFVNRIAEGLGVEPSEEEARGYKY